MPTINSKGPEAPSAGQSGVDRCSRWYVDGYAVEGVTGDDWDYVRHRDVRAGRGRTHEHTEFCADSWHDEQAWYHANRARIEAHYWKAHQEASRYIQLDRDQWLSPGAKARIYSTSFTHAMFLNMDTPEGGVPYALA